MITPRAEVQNCSPVPHGGRHGLAIDARDVVHDFSVCLNAFGPADVVRAAIRDAAIDEYPDPASRVARQAAADAWLRPVDEICLGAGAAELIDAVCRAYLSPGDRVVVDTPAFGEYERAAQLAGAAVHRVDTPPSAAWNDGAVVAAIREVRPRLVFVCSPSNPLGIARDLRSIRAIADACGDASSLLVLDQAYDAFSDAPLGTPALPSHPAVLHLRSLTKEHALAGVRVAFAVGPSHAIAALETVRVPWSASSATQAAAAATFTTGARAHAAQTISALRAEAARLRAACESLGYEIAPSSTHFFVIRVADATGAQLLLLRKAGLLVRDCSSFGLPSHIRIAARTPEANDRLIGALDQLSSLLQS
jgi:histidinol-phosphate aminotransferase